MAAKLIISFWITPISFPQVSCSQQPLGCHWRGVRHQLGAHELRCAYKELSAFIRGTNEKVAQLAHTVTHLEHQVRLQNALLQVSRKQAVMRVKRVIVLCCRLRLHILQKLSLTFEGCMKDTRCLQSCGDCRLLNRGGFGL